MTLATDNMDFNDGTLMCPHGFTCGKTGNKRAWYREDVSPKQLETLLTHEAEVLKETPKVRVSAVEHWIIKHRRSMVARSVLSPGRNRERHVCAWRAGHYLRAHGIRVPEPLAYMERSAAGVITSSWHIFQNLLQYRDVESYVSGLIESGADGLSLEAFLHHLAESLASLEACGAWHGDLSGKNIYTRDGVRFYLIDLDAVQLNVPYDEERRLKNHVQLYDSFCDALSDVLLVPFLESLLPQSCDLRTWMPRVRDDQQKRRAKVEAYWAKYGYPEHINPLRAYRMHL